MKNGIFEVGTMIKGKDLKDMVLCKVLSEDMNMRDFQYKMGENVDTIPLATEGSCKVGLYFTTIDKISWYLDYGTKLAIVEIPEEEPVYVDENKFRTHRLVIKKIISLRKVRTWKSLIEHGVDITAKYNEAVIWAGKNGYLKIVKYLHEHGADIKARSSYGVIYAAEYGHLEVVKYLYEHGVYITAGNNRAVIEAARSGHLEVVKYLYERGADITARDNYAVRCAAENSNLEVVKYLHKHGADVTACNNYVVRHATSNRGLKLVKYLHRYGVNITVYDN